MALSRVVSEIFNVEKCRDLEIGVRGHSLKVIDSGTIRYIVYGFLLAFFSNFIPKTHRFSDIRLQKCCDLENYDSSSSSSSSSSSNRLCPAPLLQSH